MCIVHFLVEREPVRRIIGTGSRLLDARPCESPHPTKASDCASAMNRTRVFAQPCDPTARTDHRPLEEVDAGDAKDNEGQSGAGAVGSGKRGRAPAAAAGGPPPVPPPYPSPSKGGARAATPIRVQGPRTPARWP